MKKIQLVNLPFFVWPLILLTVLILIRLASGFNGLYGQDSYEYLRYSRKWYEFFSNGRHPGDYFWPFNYPIYGAMLTLVVRDNIWALQLISLISFVLTAGYLYRLVQLCYPRGENKPILYLNLIFILSPFMFQSAFLIMSDMLAVFFITATVYHIIRYHREIRRVDFLLTVFFATSAVMTRYASAVVLLIPVLFLVITFLRNFRLSYLLSGIVITALCLTPHFFIRWGHPAQFLSHNWLQSWSVKNWFFSEFTTVDGYQRYRFPNLIYSFSNIYHPGFIFLGIFLLFLTRKKFLMQAGKLMLILSIVLYALFLAGIPFQNLRFLLATFPIVVVLFYLPFRKFFQWITKGKAWAVICVAGLILIQSALIIKYSAGIYRANKLERTISQSILSYPEKTIYTFGIDGALKAYGVKNPLINLWYEKIDRIEKNSLLLFNEEKFRVQWRNMNPMINWEYIHAHARLEKLRGFPDGWELFEVNTGK
ncbi:MAG: ArnT family glycosyltransferase [Calditrichia bacterium]